MAPGNLPPGLIQYFPAELIRNTSGCTDDDESLEGFGHGGYVDAGTYPPQLCIWQQDSRGTVRYRAMTV